MRNTGERIVELRAQMFERKNSEAIARLRANPRIDAESLRQSENIGSWTLRRGLLTRDRLMAMRFSTTDKDLLAGRLDISSLPDESAASEAYLRQYKIDLPGQTGHCELDLSSLMTCGIDAFGRQIQDHMDGGARDEVYQSFLYALDGLSAMIDHAADSADGDIAHSCRRIAHHPPASFADAIQLLWLVNIAVMHAERASLVGPGHLDRVLIPFYTRDINSGTLTEERALELIECLYLLINEYIPDGLAIALMVGGTDENGRDTTNPLSYLCLEALRRTRCIYPSVGICWHEGTPSRLVDTAVELMGLGYPNPAFFGDKTIQNGLKSLGVPATEACDYINSTCVEITPRGSSNVWVASPYYNTCGLLLEEMTEQAGNPASSFDDFLSLYQKRLSSAVSAGVAAQNDARLERQRYCRRPLQSVFTRDCIGRGKDIEDGGALYNWIECSFIGLANLVDSLYVIKEEVFGSGRVSLQDMITLLESDFSGQEPVRQRWLNGYPKYGQDHHEIDELMGTVVAHVTSVCSHFSVEPDNSAYVPGAFAWIQHERLGRETGATPDGRRAGFPFADGCGPAQGREKNGPTAALKSVTSWPHSQMIGGLAYNLKFNRDLFKTPEGFDGLRSLLLTYMERGGFEAQVNSVDNAVLKKARDQPEEYRDLVVRIGGYCDYFTRLSPEMQEELILRTEFESF